MRYYIVGRFTSAMKWSLTVSWNIENRHWVHYILGYGTLWMKAQRSQCNLDIGAIEWGYFIFILIHVFVYFGREKEGTGRGVAEIKPEMSVGIWLYIAYDLNNDSRLYSMNIQGFLKSLELYEYCFFSPLKNGNNKKNIPISQNKLRKIMWSCSFWLSVAIIHNWPEKFVLVM